jgi:pyrroline-5-carboxylate reductase
VKIVEIEKMKNVFLKNTNWAKENNFFLSIWIVMLFLWILFVKHVGRLLLFCHLFNIYIMENFEYEIGIIGLGHMGKAILDGLIESGNFAEGNILTSNSAEGNREVARKAKTILLAVKPEVVAVVLKDISEVLRENLNGASGVNQLIISVAAGVKIADIQAVTGVDEPGSPVVRVMPNICASVLESMSCFVKSPEVSDGQVATTKRILSSIGEEAEVASEDMIDYATAIAGSGPAYFFRMTELLIEVGVTAGFPAEVAAKLANQTLIGSAKMLQSAANASDLGARKSAGTLRSEVTSKGGTTEAALNSLAASGFGETFKNGVMAAYKRAR